jgi:hypothetical protein
MRNKKYLSPKSIQPPNFSYHPPERTIPPFTSTPFEIVKAAWVKAKEAKRVADEEEERCKEKMVAAQAEYWRRRSTYFEAMYNAEKKKGEQLQQQVERFHEEC